MEQDGDEVKLTFQLRTLTDVDTLLDEVYNALENIKVKK